MERSTRFIPRKRTSILLDTTQLWGQVSNAIPELGTVSPPAVPNWLQSPLKPRARLYMEVASSRGDYRPRVDLWWDKRLSKVQGGRCSEVKSSSNVRLANSKAGIKPTAPLSAFDKENLIEFSLDSVHYLYKQSNPNPVLWSCAPLWVNLLSCVCYYKLKEKKRKRKTIFKIKRKRKRKRKEIMT